MSHLTTVLTQIRDVEALAEACANACGELGVELLRDTEARRTTHGASGSRGGVEVGRRDGESNDEPVGDREERPDSIQFAFIERLMALVKRLPAEGP
jgi:hypothetical protein